VLISDIYFMIESKVEPFQLLRACFVLCAKTDGNVKEKSDIPTLGVKAYNWTDNLR